MRLWDVFIVLLLLLVGTLGYELAQRGESCAREDLRWPRHPTRTYCWGGDYGTPQCPR